MVLKVVVLISGGGSNLRALLARTRDSDFPVRVVAVGADRHCAGLDHARAEGIPAFITDFGTFSDREGWGEALAAEVRRFGPDLVVLSGLMRLLPGSFLAAFENRIINTHPAFLPEFPGAHAVRDALAAGASRTGASVIMVDGGVDTGPILARERVVIEPDDTEQKLHERIKRVERRLLESALLNFAAQRAHRETVGTVDIDLTEANPTESP